MQTNTVNWFMVTGIDILYAYLIMIPSVKHAYMVINT